MKRCIVGRCAVVVAAWMLMSVAHGAAAISPVAVALAEAGIAIEGLTLRTPTLDDVFVHITGGRLLEESA